MNDMMLIQTQGLDEGIRCAMCTNSMANDRGCDGLCKVDESMYQKVMNVIEKALKNQRYETISNIPDDYVYDCETEEYCIYKHKYTGKEIRVIKNPPLYKLEEDSQDNKAKWEEFYPDNEPNSRIRCSNCNEWGYTRWDIKTPFCPSCGKKMLNGNKYFDQNDNE